MPRAGRAAPAIAITEGESVVILNCTVGGTKGMFEEPEAREVAQALDHAFGEEGDWEGSLPQSFGALPETVWVELQVRAVQELGGEAVPNLLSLGREGRGVFLPAHVATLSLPLADGKPLCCASLPGLRSELSELAERWQLPMEDAKLTGWLDGSPDRPADELIAFARLALAANEATRKDCPLWLFG